MLKPTVFFATTILWLFPVSIALAQSSPVPVTVRVSVKTSQGTPIPGAMLSIGGSTVNTDSAGRFEFSGSSSRLLPVVVEHSGFEFAVRVLEVRSNDPMDVEIILVPSQDCPIGAAGNPPGALSATDFVEIEFPSQLLAGYRVRIRADGEVLWRGAFAGGFGAFPGRATVPKEDASALIEKFRRSGFWALCGTYRPASKVTVSDGPLTYTTVQIGNQIRRVVDDYRSAPAFLRDLQRDFEMLANTERWWKPSGSSPTFPLMPSPGLTVDTVRRAFAAGDINALDSRGWTPLMYATQFVPSPESIKAILDAGANPNSRSGTGETVLMIALTGQQTHLEWIRALITAGAEVNAQDPEGHTALTLAVQRFAIPEGRPSSEIISILRAGGARTDLRDNHGMTALDYLEQDAPRASKYRQGDYESLRRILLQP